MFYGNLNNNSLNNIDEATFGVSQTELTIDKTFKK